MEGSLLKACSKYPQRLCDIGTRTIFGVNWEYSLFTHGYTHPFNGPFPGLPRWAGTREVKPIWIFLKQETVSGSGISWAICKPAPRSRQITTPAPHHSVFKGQMPFLPPNQQRQSTEGTNRKNYSYTCGYSILQTNLNLNGKIWVCFQFLNAVNEIKTVTVCLPQHSALTIAKV